MKKELPPAGTGSQSVLSSRITDWCRHFIRLHVQPGDLCIDATMGKGNDTLLLSELAGPSGQVLAFDIQPEALAFTRSLLSQSACPSNYRLILDSHANMRAYAAPDSVSCIVFNFGYLPGGDHTKATLPDTSVAAIQQGLSLLRPDGLMSLCIYSGGDSGFLERDRILEHVRNLDPRRYLVIRADYYNRPNHPPIPVLIRKLPVSR